MNRIFISIISICLMAGFINSEEIKRKVVNPWKWQDKYGFVQANDVTGVKRMIFCAGQISVDDNGSLLYPNNMEKQMEQIAKNLETLFKQAGAKLSDVVRITYYTTDIKAFTKGNLAVLSKKLKKWNCRPATSLIGVAALARPGCLVELEVTAVTH